jgi:hypothetical protein
LYECFKEEHLNYYIENYPSGIDQVYRTTVKMLSTSTFRKHVEESDLNEIDQFIPKDVYLEKVSERSRDLTPDEQQLRDSMVNDVGSKNLLIYSNHLIVVSKILSFFVLVLCL